MEKAEEDLDFWTFLFGWVLQDWSLPQGCVQTEWSLDFLTLPFDLVLLDHVLVRLFCL